LCNEIENRLGPVVWRPTCVDNLAAVLDDRLKHGTRIYSSAYIMPSPAFGHARKHANHLALLVQMMDDRLPERIQQASSLRAVYESLLRYRSLGPFLAFQYAIDLNYSGLLNFDEADFVVAGPGALDGISKCFVDARGLSAEEVIHWVTERQEIEFERLELNFVDLFGRPLQPIDCQNLFCEISKYARVAHPEVIGIANRRRIKRSYQPDPRPIPPPVFPPRWHLKIPDRFVALSERTIAHQYRLF